MKRATILAILIVLALALMPGVLLAQDDDPTPLPPIEEEEPPVVVPDTGFSLIEFVTGALVGAVTTLAGVFGIVGRVKNDKSALDAIEWLGRSIPVEALDRLNELGRNLRDAGEVIDKVTDRLPNTVDTA